MAEPVTGSAESWRRDLESWAIPEEILGSAPESPWGFPTGMFRRSAEEAVAGTSVSPSRRRALEALPEAGSVLDVGAGAGAASLPLAPRAAVLTAVDESGPMLRAFADGAETAGVEHHEIEGVWPDAEAEAPVSDVVVCHHVLYNVADIVPFVSALHHHARCRVVLELTASHPQCDLSPLWLSIHGLVRPEAPTAGDAAAILEATGIPVKVERFTKPAVLHMAPLAERVAFARRRLCVGPEYDPEIERFLLSDALPAQRPTVTLWWDLD
jgi:SAM-dependent methyltransferase